MKVFQRNGSFLAIDFGYLVPVPGTVYTHMYIPYIGGRRPTELHESMTGGKHKASHLNCAKTQRTHTPMKCFIQFLLVVLFAGQTAVLAQNSSVLSTSEADTFSAQAYQLMQQGDNEKAFAAFRKALKIDRKHKGARFGMGTVLIQMGKPDYAIKILEPMMADYPEDYTLKNNIAWLYATSEELSFRDPERAISLAQSALLLAPSDYHVWSTLAEAYYIDGQYNKATRAAEQALQLAQQKNSDAGSLQEYGEQLTKCRRAAQAMSILD